MQLRGILKGHYGHILSLALSQDEKLLFSAGDENIVRIWDLTLDGEYRCKYLIHAGADCGDIHAVVYCDRSQVLYIGCKDASLQVRP